MSLTYQQIKFCEEYSVNSNSRQAAISANYDAKSADIYARQLLERDDVKAYIAILRERLANSAPATCEWKLKKLKYIVEVSTVTHFDKDNNRRLIDAKSAISALVELNKMQGDYVQERVKDDNAVAIRITVDK